MRSAVVIAALFPAAPAFGMVSGAYDSLNRIEAILALEDLPDALRQQPIGSISEEGKAKDGKAEWLIRTQDCDVIVHVTAHPPENGMVGMTTYTAEIAKGCD